MRKLLIYLIGLCVVVATAGVCRAEMVPLDDGQMAQITGRSGLDLQVDDVTFNLAMDTLYYKDADGVGASGTPGYLSLDGLHLKGAVSWDPPLVLTPIALASGLNVMTLPGLNYTLHSLDMTIDNFQIDAIRVGTSPGEGPSFGSIGIRNLTMHVEGNIQIAIHP